MKPENHRITRRSLLGFSFAVTGLATAARLTPAVASLLKPTPPQSRGPFYPPTKPLNQDNDLEPDSSVAVFDIVLRRAG